MKIIYNQNNYFSIYSTTNKHIETIYDSLDNISHSIQPSDYLLLPEDYFIFTLKHFNFYSSKPFTLSAQKQLIQEHCISDKKNNKNISELLYYNINNSSINNEKTDFILSKSGQIQFDFHCIYSHSYCPVDVNTISKNKIHILPSSYPTIQILNTQFSDNQNYNIIYINKNNSKLIIVKNGFYKNVITINIWSKDLKDIYHEQHISHIFRDPNKVSPITQKIVSDASQFFAQQIIQRAIAQEGLEKNTVIVSDLQKNHFFMESLKNIYSSTIGGYIIPFSNPLHDHEYSNWIEMDMISTLQLIKNKTWKTK